MRLRLALVGILLIAANLRASITVVGPLLGDVQGELELSASEAALLITLPVLLFAVTAPFAPLLGDKLGIEGALGLALGVLAASIVLRSVPLLPLLWVGTAGIGISVATMNVLLPPLLKRDFPSDVGRVTGLYSAAQSAVAALASSLAVPLAGTATGGWRIAFGVWAGLALVALALFIPVVSARSRSRSPYRAESSARQRNTGNLRVPWRTRLGWEVAVFSGFQALLYYTILAWWPTVERASGIGSGEAGLHQGLMQVVAIGASLGAGLLVHRSGADVRLVVLTFASPTVLGLLGQLIWPEASLLWVGLLGVGIGGTFVVSMSIISLRTTHAHQTAQLSSLAQTVGYSLAALGPLAAGGMAEITGSWTWVVVLLLALQLPQLGLGLISARPGSIGSLPVSTRVQPGAKATASIPGLSD